MRDAQVVYDHDRVMHLEKLCDILPEGHVYVWDGNLLTLALQKNDVPYAKLLCQVQFTHAESILLMTLIDNYPHHAPAEVMVARFHRHDSCTDRDIEIARTNLDRALQWQEAQGKGAHKKGKRRRVDPNSYDAYMRPVRNVLSRTRIKLRRVGLDIWSVLETGYQLAEYKPRRIILSNDVPLEELMRRPALV